MAIAKFPKSALHGILVSSPQNKSYSEALQWYNYSLSFFKGGLIDPNLAKLQRNRASCFLQLKQLEKVRGLNVKQRLEARWRCFRPLLLCTPRIDQAKEAIKEAQRCDPHSVFTHFCVYKMAMLEHNVEKGTSEAVANGRIAAFTSLFFQLPQRERP